jgi:ABC-type Fe3+-hydroxamate transport system substrate-binding protein
MIKRKLLLFAALLALGVGLNQSAAAQSGEAAVTSTSYTAVTAHGKIVEVNKAEKLVTIEGTGGRKLYLKVENPYNLEAAKVGEPVVAHFYEVVTIRKKKPGETVPSASLKEGIATAQPGQVPGAVAGQRASVLVTVDAIDEANGTVSVKGPDGTVEKVKARDPRNLKHLKVGDELVVTLARAVAISLDKESPG